MDRKIGSPRTDKQRDNLHVQMLSLWIERLDPHGQINRDNLHLQMLSLWIERLDPHRQINRDNLHLRMLSLWIERLDPHGQINRDTISTYRCYLHGQRDVIPKDRFTVRETVSTDREA
jgi:hypothetical protein